jgi:hypothetical protein
MILMIITRMTITILIIMIWKIIIEDDENNIEKASIENIFYV